MYSVVLLLAISALWISNVIVVAIQAYLGDSTRGNDIAKALSWMLIPLIALPAFGFVYLMESFTQMMGFPFSILLPSTWSADILTWSAVYFNGNNLYPSSIMNLTDYLYLHPIIYAILLTLFSAITLIVGQNAADRLFVIDAGKRSESITTIKGENFLIRGVRRLIPGYFGVLVATSFKDFGRKFQNLSKIGYAFFLIILFPTLINVIGSGNLIDDPMFVPAMIVIMVGMMLGLMAANTFGGVGFLESKDHLWILKSNPRGEIKYITSRLVSFFLMGLFYALGGGFIISIIAGLALDEVLILSLFAFLVVCGTIMISVGITALNPSYEDAKSSAFVINSLVSILVSVFSIMFGVIYAVISIIRERLFTLPVLMAPIPVLMVGIVILGLGTFRLIRSEAG
jgi:hypothetical protein